MIYVPGKRCAAGQRLSIWTTVSTWALVSFTVGDFPAVDCERNVKVSSRCPISSGYIARADVDYSMHVRREIFKRVGVSYNLATQSLVELIELSLHGGDVRMLEGQGLWLQGA
jgi:hypothetical protein